MELLLLVDMQLIPCFVLSVFFVLSILKHNKTALFTVLCVFGFARVRSFAPQCLFPIAALTEVFYSQLSSDGAMFAKTKPQFVFFCPYIHGATK
jgi:hypothetical protein